MILRFHDYSEKEKKGLEHVNPLGTSIICKYTYLDQIIYRSTTFLKLRLQAVEVFFASSFQARNNVGDYFLAGNHFDLQLFLGQSISVFFASTVD